MKTVTLVLFAVGALIAYALRWYGVFAPLKPVEKQAGPYLIVYKAHVGDYKNAGKVMDELFYDLKDNFGLDTTKGFGLYYDKPQDTPVAKRRSILGVIIEGKTEADLSEIAQKFSVATFPESKSVVLEFPYKGQLSILAGVFRAYPKLAAHVKENDLPASPIFEIYDQPNQVLTYIVPYATQTEVFENLLR